MAEHVVLMRGEVPATRPGRMDRVRRTTVRGCILCEDQCILVFEIYALKRRIEKEREIKIFQICIPYKDLPNNYYSPP
jgi:hypothetical protein